MKLGQIVQELGLKVMTNGDMDREACGVYISDMLSWVMSHAEKNNVWVTVQNNVNIVAIATLIELSCIIIPENITLDELTQKKAKEKDLVILSTDMNGYQICSRLSQMGL